MFKVADLLQPQLPAPAGGPSMLPGPTQAPPPRQKAPGGTGWNLGSALGPGLGGLLKAPSAPSTAPAAGASGASGAAPAKPLWSFGTYSLPHPARDPMGAVKALNPGNIVGGLTGTTPPAAGAVPAAVPSRYDFLAGSTGAPGTALTHHLGSFKGPADGALNFVQQQLSGEKGPQTFASFAGALGRPLMEPIMATPFGAPVLAGLYGGLRGGESFAAAEKLFRPLLGKFGLGGPQAPPQAAPIPAAAITVARGAQTGG